MSSRSKWEDMVNYPKDLVAAVKDARAEGAKREASEKAKQYIKEAEAKASAPKAAPKQETSEKKGTDISIGSTVEKIKARNKMMSEL